jgi:hypothetical protein
MMTLALLQSFGFSVSVLLATAVNYAYYILFGFVIAWIVISWLPGYPSSRCRGGGGKPDHAAN